MGRAYGQPPHKWMFYDEVLTSFDWQVFSTAQAK